jgi:hypothetical protein
MTLIRRPSCISFALLLACALSSGMARAADDDAAALDLVPAEQPAPAAAGTRPLRLFGELAVGRLQQRDGLPSKDARRASLDLTGSFKAGGWRGVFSDRLDDMHPVDAGSRSTLNSLRELYIGWQGDGGRLSFDVGRVNHRNGPAYGFNPTDYFRDGSVRAVSSNDPLAQRENRLGTVMLRAQQLWQGGGVSLALAPKLRDEPSSESFSADWGATNHADRALLGLSLQPNERINLQGFAFHQRGRGLQLGANGSALLGGATVGFFEWSGGKDQELLASALGSPFSTTAPVRTRQRAAAGLTYTTASRLSLTAEYEYNGFALDKAQWQQAATLFGPGALGAYLYEAQRRQDIAARRALMLYLSQRDAGIKNLELTGLLRHNLEDSSQFVWLEARYHWSRVDLALQWQANLGGAETEYGLPTGRRLLQLLLAFYL